MHWLFKLDEPLTGQIHLFKQLGCGLSQACNFENEWIKIEDGLKLTVKVGYAWDGCSPKVYIGKKWYGTPDGPISAKTGKPVTWRASGFHDAMYQFAEDIAEACGVSVRYVLKEADGVFKNYMLLDGAEKWRTITYFYAVRLCGYGFHKIIRAIYS